ncbi:cytochrome P450 [Amycolatopsis sp. DG1A-15b]|uniref:cytochrome P450 n=1 Tax=Amycolatopsis sp. DG1A-15b TaxID=3052846 RepID=UPI00255B5CAB|nr:cytochrome P450 [Amycolatopsis sp. DG1A-15b]WIX91492.1 cytochrome P450 [Amycolatopsis sp. DG1A-15b]
MTDSAFPPPRTCPYTPPPRLGELQRDAPVTRVRIWDGSTPWLLTRYDDVRAVLADRRFSVDPTRPGYPARGPAGRARRRGAGSFISMDAPEHTRLRRMLIREFTPRRIEALRPALERTAAELLDELAGRPQPADLVAGFALPLPSIAIAELLGVSYDDHEFFEDRARVMTDDSAGGAANRAATADLARHLGTLLQRRREHPADDLLGRLSAGQVEPGNLSRAEAVSMAVLLLVAGHETTANQIALSVAFLLDNPELAEFFRRPEGPPAGAVDELLRLLTITHTGRRRVATADVPIAGGITIRAGDGVIAAADIANRDPARFPDPDRADFGRSPNHHLAFGHGEHLCLGHHLARLELRVALTTLFRRLPGLRLAAPAADLPFRHTHPIYGVDRLPVAWD